MSQTVKHIKRVKPQRFVQIISRPSLGIEISTGQAWFGVDQQVGHGSADALFALTDEQYAAALLDGFIEQPLHVECWQGEHPELLLFYPGGGAWLPNNWFARQTRMMPTSFDGELWHHIDALGEPVGGEQAELSRGLAAGTAQPVADSEGLKGLTFRLAGGGAYPRPAALIAGLSSGSDREKVRKVLGAPAEAASDEYLIGGVRMRLAYVDGGLVEVGLERLETLPMQ